MNSKPDNGTVYPSAWLKASHPGRADHAALRHLGRLIRTALQVTHLAVVVTDGSHSRAAFTSGWSPNALTPTLPPTPQHAFHWQRGRSARPAFCHALLAPADDWSVAAGAPLLTPAGARLGLLFVARRGGRNHWSTAHRAELRRSAQLIAQVIGAHATREHLTREQRESAALRRRLNRSALTARTFQAIADLTTLPLDEREGLHGAARLSAALIGVDWSGVQTVSGGQIDTVWPSPAPATTPRQPTGIPGHGPVCTLDGASGWTFQDQPAALAWIEAPEHGARLLFVRFGRTARWTSADRQVLRDLVWALQHVLAITAQRSALHGLEGQLRFALRSFPMLLWVTDHEGRLIAAEGSALQQIRPHEPLTGRPLVDLIGDALEATPEPRSRAAQTITLAGRSYETHRVRLPNFGQLGVAFDVTELTESRAAARQAQLQAETLLALTGALPVSGDLRDLSAQALDVLIASVPGIWLVFWEHHTQERRLRALLTRGEVPPALMTLQTQGFSDTDRYAQRLLNGQTVHLQAEHLPEAVRHAGLQAALLLPIRVTSTYVLAAYRGDRGVWTAAEQELLTVAERVLQVNLERHDTLKQLQNAATTDALTGLGNRRAFETEFREALRRGELTLVTLDVDNLKLVNDRDGHARGDALLRAVGAALRDLVPGSQAFRVGGDEFCLLASGTHPEILDWLEQATQPFRQQFADAGASAGAVFAPSDGTNPEALWQLADERMYARKTQRRGVAYRSVP